MNGQTRPQGVDDAEQKPAYAVAATESLHELRTMTLKNGDTFAVFNRAGDIRGEAGATEGVFHLDTRHLSQFVLTVGGVRPMLLSATMRDDNAILNCDLANPEIADGQSMVDHNRIHIRRSRFLWNGSCMERIAARNFDPRPRRIEFEITFGADFVDLFEVRGARRERRGTLGAPEVSTDTVRLSYMGLDDELRETTLRFDPAPDSLSSGRATYSLELAPGQWRSIFIEVACEPPKPARGERAFLTALRDSKRALHRASERAVKISSTNESFNETIGRSVSDLYMLLTDTPQGPFPYAGVPWFSTTFGPRRADNGAADALARSRDRRPACSATSPRPRRRRSTRAPTRSPEKSCTRHATARWRFSARCRSAATTAASIRRRCSSCSLAHIWSAPGMSPPWSASGLTSRRR